MPSLLWHLLLSVGLVTTVALSLHVFFQVAALIDKIEADQRNETREIFDLLSPVLIEYAIVGDYIAIKELLDSQTKARTNADSMSWIALNGAKIGSAAIDQPVEHPVWFARYTNLQPQRSEHTLQLGGVPYGALEVSTTIVAALNEAWTEFVDALIRAGVILTVILLTIATVLRTSMKGLRSLTDGLERFRREDFSVRVPAIGATEFRDAAVAFNILADRVQSKIIGLSNGHNDAREQLRFTKEILEAVPFPLYYQNSAGQYLGVNRAWEQFFGLTKEATHGRTNSELFANTENEAPFKIAIDPNAPLTQLQKIHELPIVDHHGRTHYALSYRAAFTDTNGLLSGTVGSFIDVSDRKRTEERARSALVDKLSAESANKAKSAFLANMSHEIRTPLTAIIGFSESLLDGDSTMEERVEAINTIIRSGRHLLQIINDILDLSKLEAEKLSIEKISVPIFPMLDDLRALAHMQATEKGIEFIVDYVFPLPESIYSDPARLKQILLNLANNALKFTNSGSVTIRVAYDEPSGLLRFDVIDTGVGMSSEQIDRLFAPFAQVDASTTRRYGGTGLGLYLSKLLVDKLGGQVKVTSEPNHGSTFTATVSVGNKDDLNLVNEIPFHDVSNASTRTVERPSVRGRILFADDNFDNQRLVSLYIKKMGAEVDLADNGRIAVEKALLNHYDLIFMDIQMPIMDGHTATRQLRNTGFTGPIVALTANAMPDDQKRCFESGCTGFLPKPIDQARFNETVKRHLQDLGEKQEGADSIRSTLAEDDPELIDLINRFVEKYPSLVGRIAGLLEAGEWEKLKKEVHDLKGVGGGYGFPRVSELAAKAEFAIAKQNYAEAQTIVQELDRLKSRLTVEQTTRI